MKIQYDTVASIIYIPISQKKIAKTISYTKSGINIDVDEQNEVVGIEIYTTNEPEIERLSDESLKVEDD